MPPKPKLSTDIEQEIAQRHLSGERIYLLAREYNVWPSRIRSAIERHGGQFVSFDYKFNEHAFDVLDNEQACYWLGFIFADGYVSPEGLRINIKRSDEQHLHKFKAFMQADQSVGYDVSRAKGRDHLRAHIMIADRQFAKKLAALGIEKDRPDPLRSVLSIPSHLIHHWFRGFFDGDGCAHKTGDLTFLGPEPILMLLRTALRDCGTLALRSIAPDGPRIIVKPSICRLHFSGVIQCRRIAEYLYRDATVWMERKRTIIDNWPNPWLGHRKRFKA